jgi:2-oxoglutarate/2-oxoacid ferredoxin oxidoreductase subunit beta
MTVENDKKHVVADYKRGLKPVWCTSCGDYGVLQGMYRALNELDVDPENVALISGIGCSSRLPGYVNTYGFNSVHGRGLPLAQGLKLARPDITVLAMGGDGDGISIGMGHFPHAARRNVDMTYIMMDNFIYGLTKGQTSPTTPHGDITISSPYGSIDTSLDPVKLALSFNVSFIARVFAGDLKHMALIFKQAIEHKGFSFVHAISPCSTYRGLSEFKRVRGLVNKVEPTGDELANKSAAFAREEEEEGINLGILYKVQRPTFGGELDRMAQAAMAGNGNRESTMHEFLNEFMP